MMFMVVQKIKVFLEVINMVHSVTAILNLPWRSLATWDCMLHLLLDGGEDPMCTPWLTVQLSFSLVHINWTPRGTGIKDQIIRFSFIDSKTGYIELLLQDSDICHGWYIEPHMEPLKVNNEHLKTFHVMMNIVLKQVI